MSIQSGVIEIDGRDVTRVAANKRGIGLVFQDARLFPHLSVAGNLHYAERRAGNRPGAELDEVVASLGLGRLMQRATQDLSGGERQRVAITRSPLSRPQLLLMDEPLAALDLQRRAELLPYLESLPKNFAVPIIYVTHALDEVARLATQMVALTHGRGRPAAPPQRCSSVSTSPRWSGRPKPAPC